MKLCAGILYWGLKELLKTVELHGAGSQELTLVEPEFYLDRTKRLKEPRLRLLGRSSADTSVAQCKRASSVWGSTGT